MRSWMAERLDAMGMRWHKQQVPRLGLKSSLGMTVVISNDALHNRGRRRRFIRSARVGQRYANHNDRENRQHDKSRENIWMLEDRVQRPLLVFEDGYHNPHERL